MKQKVHNTLNIHLEQPRLTRLFNHTLITFLKSLFLEAAARNQEHVTFSPWTKKKGPGRHRLLFVANVKAFTIMAVPHHSAVLYLCANVTDRYFSEGGRCTKWQSRWNGSWLWVTCQWVEAAEENINESVHVRPFFSARTDKTDQSVKPSLFGAAG